MLVGSAVIANIVLMGKKGRNKFFTFGPDLQMSTYKLVKTILCLIDQNFVELHMWSNYPLIRHTSVKFVLTQNRSSELKHFYSSQVINHLDNLDFFVIFHQSLNPHPLTNILAKSSYFSFWGFFLGWGGAKITILADLVVVTILFELVKVRFSIY